MKEAVFNFSTIIVMSLMNSFKDGNDLNLRHLNNISDVVSLVCRCTWAEREITTPRDTLLHFSFHFIISKLG